MKLLRENFLIQFTVISLVVLAVIALVIALLLTSSIRPNTIQFTIAGFLLLYGLVVGIVWRGWRNILRYRRERTQAEELFITMSNSSPAGIYVVSQGKFRFINPQFERITGYNKDQLLDVDPLSIVFSEDRELVRENAIKMLKGQTFSPYEYRVVAESGDVRWVMETVVSINYEGKRAVLGNHMDITDRRKVEMALKEADEKLRQAQKMEAIGRLAGGVAHDFNNILTVITVCTDMMLNEIQDDDPMRRDLVEISKAAERASLLTKQLLIFSRKQTIEPEVLHLDSVIMDLEKMLVRLVGEDCQVETVLEDNLPTVKSDRGGIEQVVANLVVNARDAIPGRGRIIIQAETVTLDKDDSLAILEARPGEFVRLSVTDTGTGMNQDTMQHIFEPFYTTKGAGKGTGLGLSTAYGIVKQNNGWINVYSDPGHGSTFRVYFPVNSDGAYEQCELTNRNAVSRELDGKGEKILLVEDEDSIRDMIYRILNEHGYYVVAAASVKEALDLFTSGNDQFNLLLSDVVLTDGSGAELAGRLVTLDTQLQVILSSGYADEKSQHNLISEKGYTFVQKPYTIEKLLQTIRNKVRNNQDKIDMQSTSSIKVGEYK